MLEINSEGTVDLIIKTKFVYFTYFSGKINKDNTPGTLCIFDILGLSFSITLGLFNYAHLETSNYLVSLHFIKKVN